MMGLPPFPVPEPPKPFGAIVREEYVSGVIIGAVAGILLWIVTFVPTVRLIGIPCAAVVMLLWEYRRYRAGKPVRFLRGAVFVLTFLFFAGSVLGLALVLHDSPLNGQPKEPQQEQVQPAKPFLIPAGAQDIKNLV